MSLFTLARWLGPWADAEKVPRVESTDDELGGVRVRIYGDPSREPSTRYLIGPGLHYAGPDDPRMDRFCRILAAAGHHVVAPFIPAYLRLMPNATAKDDFLRVFDQAWPQHKVTVFSISFGSLLAFATAAERSERIERLVVFGGYSDFHQTMKFCLTGEVPSGRQASRDPLNQPAVFMNFIEDLVHDRAHTDALLLMWLEYIKRVWGRAHFKVDRKFVEIAEALAPEVPESVRELYRIGTGVLPGAPELVLPAIARFDASALDPTPYLARVTNRVDLVHGVDDDVIPFEQSHELAARLVNADVRVHITGMYGHTGAQRLPIGTMARELVTMVRVLRVLAG
ncbi:MAG TPA: alpha/beta hydrolase [Kofleriaceae bacterium]|nr:alpha/beta hydrolase [Kofleriaceae bacterium]